MSDRPRTFWEWFLRGPHPGWKRFADKWLIFHVVVGALVGWLVPLSLAEGAKAVLLPLAGVLVGMSFAWVGNALAIAQSAEVERLAEQHPGGYEDYVHPFQAAILVLLSCLVAWGLAGLGVFDLPCPWSCSPWPYRVASALLYGIASLAVRECWHVVMGAQLLLLFQRAVHRVESTRGASEGSRDEVNGPL